MWRKNELSRVGVTPPLNNNKLEKLFFVNTLFYRCSNAPNAINHDRALVVLYASQISACFCQPNLRKSKLKIVGVEPSPLHSKRVNHSLMQSVYMTFWTPSN